MKRTLQDIITLSKQYITEELSFEEIKWLLKDIFSLKEYELIIRKNDYFEDENFFVLLKKAQDIPVSYLLGYQDFYSYRFKVNQNVLIPRNETEELVSMCLKFIKDNNYKSVNILEIGSGSGCIAISLDKELEKENIIHHIVSTDISLSALEVANENKKILNSKVNFIYADVISSLEENNFDIIISNPPYIEKNEFVSQRVLNNEPQLALFSDDTGLLIYEKIFIQIKEKNIKPLKCLMFEISPKIVEGLENKKNHYLKNYQSNYLKDINNFIRFALYTKND